MIFFQMILDGLQSAIVFFVALIILFFPMERVFPAYQKQRFFRPSWWVDFLFFIGQFLLWTILVISLITTLNSLFFDYISINYARYTSSLPVWIQFIMIVLLSDLSIYWFHRWQHHNRFYGAFIKFIIQQNT
jgi:sterol desaturase/sphingolipid hydroxylase (fatty acid hydroxylase superfamily)